MREKDFIPSIFNYCDRWCERCAFTNRCRVYAEESNLSNEERGINNELFWSRIGESFEKAIDTLYKMVEEMGLDLEMFRIQVGKEGEIEGKGRIIKTEHLDFTRQIGQYPKAVLQWLRSKEIEEQFSDKSVQLQQLQEIGVGTIEAEVEEIQNALKIIRWYMHFIGAKIQRALSQSEYTWGEEDVIQNDSNGSAKIALIAIQRSMGAWEILRSHFPDMADDLIDFLVMLEKIKAQLTHLFPHAEQFHRPGFDD